MVGFIRPATGRLYPTFQIESDLDRFSKSQVKPIYSLLPSRHRLIFPSVLSLPIAACVYSNTIMPAPVAQPKTLYDKIWDDHVV